MRSEAWERRVWGVSRVRASGGGGAWVAQRARVLASLGVALVLPLAFGACAGEEKDAPSASAEAPKERLTRVEAAKLSAVEFTSYTMLTGQTEADETVTVAAETAGRVTAKNFDEGSEVTEGQWLIRVDTSLDRAQIAQLQVNLDKARRDLKLTEELLERGLATPVELDRAQTGLRAARAQMQVSRVGVGRASVASPIAGVVDAVMIKEGEFASPGMPIAKIVRYDTIVVRAGLPESKLGFAKVGAPVRVRVRALGREVEGKITRIGIQADTKNRTFPVQVEVDNKDRSIRPGMRADVILPTEHYPKAVMIPRTSIIQTLDSQVVYVVGAGDKAERRVVVLGPGRGEHVMVREGVKEGESIVTTGQQFLTQDEPVKVLKTEACCAAQMAPAKAGDRTSVKPVKGQGQGQGSGGGDAQ